MNYLMEVTSQSLATAALQILLPRNPLPPQTTSLFFAAAVDMFLEISEFLGEGIDEQRSQPDRAMTFGVGNVGVMNVQNLASTCLTAAMGIEARTARTA